MKTSQAKSLFTLLLLLLIGFVSLQAQTERAKRRAANRANQHADRKVDEAVDQTVNAIEGLFRKRNKQEEETVETDETEIVEEGNNDENVDETNERERTGVLGGLSFGNDFEPYENPARMSFKADITTTRRNKTDEMSIAYTFDTWATGMEMISEDGKFILLFDNQEGYMTTVTTDKDGEQQAVKMRQRTVKVNESEMGNIDAETPGYSITKTGNTKTIDGYFCEEYLVEYEEGTSNTWITEELDVEYNTLFEAMTAQYMSQSKTPSAMLNPYGIEGFPVEIHSVSKDGKDSSIMHFYDLKLNDIDLSIFDLDGIEVMDIGF